MGLQCQKAVAAHLLLRKTPSTGKKETGKKSTRKKRLWRNAMFPKSTCTPLAASLFFFFVSLFPGEGIFWRSFLANSVQRASFSSQLAPIACKITSLPWSKADSTRMGFHTIVFPSWSWKLLEGSICNSNPPSLWTPEKDSCQKSCQPKLSFSSERKQSAHPRRIFCKPFVAQTTT